MNRRTLLLSGLALPAVPNRNFPLNLGSVRQSFAIDQEVSCQMIVTAHTTGKLAEDWRQTWVGRAFEGQGEWYLDSTDERDLPDELESMPGSLHYHTFTAGVAAQKGSMLVGTFRHEHIACVIRTKGDHEEDLLDLVRFFADQEVPDVWELAWNDAQLRAFIPTSDTFDRPIEPNDGWWF